MAKMTAVSAFAASALGDIPLPQKNHFWCFPAFFALFFPLAALFSYKNTPLFPSLVLSVAASGQLCSEYSQAGYPPSPLSGGYL
jgi:hypothetical protein